MRQYTSKDIKIVKGLPPKAKVSDRVSLDLEMFGMDKKRLHRPDNGTFASLACSFDGKTVYMIFDDKEIKKFLANLDKGVWIFHNAKFDITHLRRYATIKQRTKLWDTMLIEQIMYSGLYRDFTLADVTRRRLNIYLPKEQRLEFTAPDDEDEPELSKEINKIYKDRPESNRMTKDMIEYAAYDVIATWQIFKDQRSEIDETDLSIWNNIELPFLWCLLSMSGVKLDVDKWTKLAEKNKEYADSIRKKYKDINLNSPAQVKKKLNELGYHIASTGEAVLVEIADNCKFAKDMMFFRTYAKRASTYGVKFVEDHVDKIDGRVHADIFQIGAETGRTSCRAPNLQNQPNEFDYRDCFIADDDSVLVIGDWSAQEPRIAAFVSSDKTLKEILNSGKDLYIEVARLALGEKIKKSDPRRKDIKALVLGIFYGMQAFGLGRRLGIPEEDAQVMINKFFRAFPGVKEYIEKQSHAGDYVTSIYGRKIWLNHYSDQWERNACNAPIQSSAADAMKIAARTFLDDWAGSDFYTMTPLELLVHDEMAIEVPKKFEKKGMEMLEEAMVSTANDMHKGIKGVVEIYSGPTWAAKH